MLLCELATAIRKKTQNLKIERDRRARENNDDIKLFNINNTRVTKHWQRAGGSTRHNRDTHHRAYCGLWPRRARATHSTADVPLIREGVKAAFCVKNRASIPFSPGHSLIILVDTPAWVCTPDAMRSVLCTIVALWSGLLLLCVRDPGLLLLWSLSAAVPLLWSVLLLFSCVCLAVCNRRTKNTPENQMMGGARENQKGPKRGQKGRGAGWYFPWFFIACVLGW